MDARTTRAALLAAALLLVSLGAKHRTANFIVETADPQMAAQLGQAAEQYRHDLAIAWLGEPLPNWSQPCPMTVQVGPNLGAGGATSFMFDHGEVFGWRMTIQGSSERLFDSVLPHEITHMIFASHFRQPLPRWADEGGATSVECASERNRHHEMLRQFLQTGRGIAFNQMFAMRDYPSDIMPLYAQGYSTAEFLIQHGGRRKYVDFLGDGLAAGNWAAAVRKHYGLNDLGALQTNWLAWVRQGSPQLAPAAPETAPAGDATLLAAATRGSGAAGQTIPATLGVSPMQTMPAAQALATAQAQALTATSSVYARPRRAALAAPAGSLAAAPRMAPAVRPMAPIAWPNPPAAAQPSVSTVATANASVYAQPAATALPADGWHRAGAAPASGALAMANSGPQALPASNYSEQVSRPQPFQQPGQIVLNQYGQ